MAPYNNQYGGYYDPVGSQANQQPTGYRYQAPATSTTQYPSAASTSYQSTNYPSHGSTYGSQQQQYGTAAQGNNSGTTQAATALSNLSSTNYNSQANAPAAATTALNGVYDNSSWTYTGYTASQAPLPNRTQSSQSPIYATQNAASTFGRLSVSEQAQPSAGSDATTYAQQAYQNARASATPSTGTYQSAYTQPAQSAQAQQPQRYASPLHAQQAQQAHHTQSSRGSVSQVSPQLSTQPVQQAHQRQQSVSVDPASATVNPSQVYDDTAERRRKAQIEAEKRRKREEEEAARKAEEERIAAEERAVMERRRAEEEKRKQEEEATLKAATEAAAKTAELARKKEEKRLKRVEKRQSKTAATALQKMSSSVSMDAPANAAPPGNPEEEEMRAMFQKMREFNAKNPAMLAKLWEEERKSHASPTPAKAAPTSAPKPRAAAAPKSAAPQMSNMLAQQSQSPPPPPPSQKPPAPMPSPMPKTAAQTMTTSTQPMASQSNSSLWPPQKKGSLAEAAAKWLMALPANTGKSISKDSVLKILEANPSYVQLCEALEAIGLRFERSLLARELLKAVPDRLKTPAQQPAKLAQVSPAASSTNNYISPYDSPADFAKRKRGQSSKDSGQLNGGSSASGLKRTDGMVDYEAPRFTSLADAAREVNSMGNVPADTGILGGPVQSPGTPSYPTPAETFGNVGRALSMSQQPEKKPIAPVEAPRRPPANKEEAARKTFGDLVDLTAADSDDDGPPPKILQTALGQSNGVSSQSNSAGFMHFQAPMPYSEFARHGQRPTHPMMPGQGGSHPSGPPPPAQMVAPTTAYSAPPAQPSAPLPPPKPKGPNHELLQHERVKGKMLVEPIMRDRVARKSKYDSRTIARDVLLATGRHPDMRALNSHLGNLQRLLGTHGGGYETEAGRGDRSDLSTIRWDIIDPGEPKPITAKLLAPKSIASGSKLENVEVGAGKSTITTAGDGDATEDADDEDDELASANTVRHVAQRMIDNGDGTVQYVSVQDQLGQKMQPKKKRRGRPPRHSVPGFVFTPNMQSGAGATSVGQRDSTSTPNRQAGTTTAPRSAPVGSRANAAGAPAVQSSAGGGAVGYSQFAVQYDENGNRVKKKGRPVGWRKDLHSRAAQGLAPASGVNSHRGPSQNKTNKIKPAEDNKEKIVEPTYRVWKCKWRDCRAELHNLETLKKHVVKLHGKPTEEDWVYECLWQGCEAESEHAGRGKGKGKAARVARFASMEGWLGHVDQAHLQPVAWELGDGPRGGLSDHYATDSEAPYLSDAHGRSVTPLIVPDFDRAEATSRVVPKALRRPGAYMTKDEKKAAAELEGLEAQKKVVGPVMDRLGVRFANKKRRMGFLDDEDFEDEVVSEGEHGVGEDEEEDEDEDEDE